MPALLLLAAAAAPITAFPGIDPEHALNITLYHVLPLQYPGVENMDTGDVYGDMYFDWYSSTWPLYCANDTDPKFGVSCTNKGVEGNTTIAQVVVEVDSRFNDTGYGKCNICENGTVPYCPACKNQNMTCSGDDYVCVCAKSSGGFWPDACGTMVGRQSPNATFGALPESLLHHQAEYAWWIRNLIWRLGGYWFSTTTDAKCDGSGAPCGWRVVKEQKRITQECQRATVRDNVEKMNPGCFQACGDAEADLGSRCFASCFYNTVLGDGNPRSQGTIGNLINASDPLGGVAGHFPYNASGLTREALAALWTAPFDTCPNVTPE